MYLNLVTKLKTSPEVSTQGAGAFRSPLLFLMRTFIYIDYIDGFNIYYRALRKTPYKWLDLKLLCERLLSPNNKILKIRYFTARASGVFDPKTPIRQKAYIRALETYVPGIEVIYGHFKTHQVKMLKAPITDPRQYCTVVKTEEKGSDVNLAVHLINDYWLDRYDCAVVISNDSDLSEPLRLINSQKDKVIGLICPFSEKKVTLPRNYVEMPIL